LGICRSVKLKQKLKWWIRRKAVACLPPRAEQNISVEQALLVSQYHMMKHVLPPSQMPPLAQTGFKIYSQFEEDGLLLYIFSVIGANTRRVVEICAGDGTECNAANLIVNHGWDGLLLDGDADNVKRGNEFFRSHARTWLHPPQFVHAWITRDNVNALIREHGFSGEIDLLSLDIDGNDYWILEALDAISPRVAICEAQNAAPPEAAVVQPYDEDFRLDPEREKSGFHSASLAAMEKLLRLRGYRLIGASRHGFNAIFMRNDAGEKFFPAISVESALDNPYSRAVSQAKWAQAQAMPWIQL